MVIANVEMAGHGTVRRETTGPPTPTATSSPHRAAGGRCSTDLPRDRILRAAAAAVESGGHSARRGSRRPAALGAAPGVPWRVPRSRRDRRNDRPADSAWVLVTCDVSERLTTDPSGEPATVRDSVVKARRRMSAARSGPSGTAWWTLLGGTRRRLTKSAQAAEIGVSPECPDVITGRSSFRFQLALAAWSRPEEAGVVVAAGAT